MTDQLPPGHMRLWDRMEVPLRPGDYRVGVATTVPAASGDPGPDAEAPLPTGTHHLRVEGPRFQLAPTEVAGVFPPRNGHGPFEDLLPHVALGRRSLPWERRLDDGPIPAWSDEVRPVSGDTPWLALLLFEGEEATILRDRALSEVLPPAVYKALGSPAGIRCDAVEAPASLLKAILPSREELALLCHARQVNVDDRELAAGDSDGWFSVVVSNRLPRGGHAYLACLVSVEGRTDLVPDHSPAVASAVAVRTPDGGPGIGAIARATKRAADAARTAEPAAPSLGASGFFPAQAARLVLLHAWSFECEGDASFKRLLQRVQVDWFGVPDPSGYPRAADTGHVVMKQTDRAGTQREVWYRGPLVNAPLTREEEGPYHAADQARRPAPETGGEDISYAAAFEVGRLLAAADARLAQELLRWRRRAYQASARETVLARLRAVSPRLKLSRSVPVAPLLTLGVAERVLPRLGPIADRYGLASVTTVPGLDPQLVSEARALVPPGLDDGSLAAAISAPGLQALAAARSKVVKAGKRPPGGTP